MRRKTVDDFENAQELPLDEYQDFLDSLTQEELVNFWEWKKSISLDHSVEDSDYNYWPEDTGDPRKDAWHHYANEQRKKHPRLWDDYDLNDDFIF